MTVEMVIKRLYFASTKKCRNCTFRFEKLYVSFSRLYMSVFCVCCEFRGLFFADRVYGFDPQCPGRRDDACQQAAQDEDPQREHSHTEGDLP